MACNVIQTKWLKYAEEQNEIRQEGNNGSLWRMRLEVNIFICFFFLYFLHFLP